MTLECSRRVLRKTSPRDESLHHCHVWRGCPSASSSRRRVCRRDVPAAEFVWVEDNPEFSDHSLANANTHNRCDTPPAQQRQPALPVDFAFGDHCRIILQDVADFAGDVYGPAEWARVGGNDAAPVDEHHDSTVEHSGHQCGVALLRGDSELVHGRPVLSRSVPPLHRVTGSAIERCFTGFICRGHRYLPEQDVGAPVIVSDPSMPVPASLIESSLRQSRMTSGAFCVAGYDRADVRFVTNRAALPGEMDGRRGRLLDSQRYSGLAGRPKRSWLFHASRRLPKAGMPPAARSMFAMCMRFHVMNVRLRRVNPFSGPPDPGSR